MKQTERDQELNKLHNILQEIHKQLAKSAENCDDQQSELLNTLKDYWDNAGGNIFDEAQLVESVERQKALSTLVHHRYKQLKKMLNSPYFGRIDFTEDDKRENLPEQIYIGISSLACEHSGAILIYDWRTPIASMYYDFERGRAWYHSLEGIVAGTISLKRQYKIVNGTMQYMFDVDVNINDVMLQELLGKNVDDKMHTIVNSIQREQNQVIRDQHHRVLFVQGPAGSGKTSIALHRIAYLLYRDRQSLTASNVLILSPNHIFSDYISNVLPEIGEENVLQLTFQDYAKRMAASLAVSFEDRAAHLESLMMATPGPDLAARIDGIQFKSSPAFNIIIDKFIAFVQHELVRQYPAIEFAGQTIFSTQDWQHYFYSVLSYLPLRRRLAKIQEIIQVKMRPLTHALRQRKEAEITAASEEVNAKTIKALARVAAKKELDPLFNKVAQLTKISTISLYRRLWTDSKLFRQLAAEIELPENLSAIRRQTLASLKHGHIFYEDCFPLLYLQGMIEGFAARRDVKHVVIDEAQDYTLLQYKILANIFPNCAWTIFGDFAQSIHPYLQTADYEQANAILNNTNAFIFKLTRSYRSTAQITAFSQALLPDKVSGLPLTRLGPLPQLVHVSAPADMPTAISAVIRQYQQQGLQSIAIICKSIREAACIYEDLHNQNHVKASLVTNDDDTFHRSIVIIPAYLAKGLEFGAVLAVNVDNKTYQVEGERSILYTICTRALHCLSLFYCQQPSRFITEIDCSLYEHHDYKQLVNNN